MRELDCNKWGKRTFIILVSVLLLVIVTACGGAIKYKNHKADDVISKAIYEEFGDDIYYQGKSDSPNVDVYYDYLFRMEDTELLCKLIATVNKVIEEEGITDKIIVRCCREIPGGWNTIVLFSNFSDYEDTVAEYQGLQRMTLIGDRHALAGEYYFYDNPAPYTNIPNIKSILIYEKMQEKAEAQGIDWYECYPDLEVFEVYIPEN